MHQDLQQMAKHFKLRFSLLPSIQLCRPKKSSLPKSPVTRYKFHSPLNSLSFDISYPNSPNPPPSTPDHPLHKCHMQSKIIPFGCDFQPTCSNCLASEGRINFPSNTFSKMPRKDEPDHNSPVLYDSKYDGTLCPPIAHSKYEKKRKDENINKKLKPSTRTGSSSVDTHKTEALYSSHHLNYPTETISEKPPSKNKKMKEKSVLKGLMPCMVNREVGESYIVRKRSVDPYEDFKRSMLEMIMDKHAIEAKELEQLLLCFLSLNARQYHAVIIEAFTEIWKDLLSGS